MDEPQNTTTKPGYNPLPVIGWFILTVILYLLSIGPVVYFYRQGMISYSTIETLAETVYLPIRWLARESELFADIMQKYFDLWDSF